MATWAISVVGLIILTVLCDIILPEGETNKYIKSVIGIVAVLVLVSPLPGLINGDYQLDLDSTNSQTQEEDSLINENYLQYVCQVQGEQFSNRVKLYLKEKGYGDCEVQTTYIYDQQASKINLDNVSVFLDKSVINGQENNIYITEDVRKCLCEIFVLNYEQVEVYV